METRKLYYEDPFQKGFATTVVSCDAVKGGYAVVVVSTRCRVSSCSHGS